MYNLHVIKGLEALLFLLPNLSLKHAYYQSSIFKTFELSLQESYHLDDPSLFEVYVRPPL